MFFGQDYAISEAKIAYVEVPKVALLRGLAGSMAVLWALEWAIRSNVFQDSFPSLSSISISVVMEKIRPIKALSRFGIWLKVHPLRWFLLAAGLFFGSTLLSTVLSGSVTTSIWGEIPGQDGYATYTIASYGILFGVIATHLKAPAQIGRLLGAVVAMGSLVGLYGILQHYGHDFFHITEGTGGGTYRVTIFMGNTLFAAAVLSMTVPLTLVAAAITFQDKDWGDSGPLSRLGQLGRNYLFTSLWSSLLTLQLLGLMFTFGRGAWGGAIIALVVFLGLVVFSLGWKVLIRTGVALALAGILSTSFLHWQGSVTIINVGPSLGIAVALLGLASTLVVLIAIQRYGRAALLIGAMGMVVVIVGASIIAPSALSGRGTSGSESVDGSTESQIGQRITSIKTDVLGGFVGGRATHWKVSWTLIKDRPWFAFDSLSLSWLRPLIGYGPDLFRYTYLLESTSDEFNDLPLEPDHAHNFFIHQTVEQGIIGGIASVALFVSAFGVVVHHMVRRRQTGDPMYRLLLFGMVAIIIGRFLEMMVGVARVSDLTVLWVIFGLFAALLSFDARRQDQAVPATSQPDQPIGNRSRRRAARVTRTSTAKSFSTGLIFRLAMVAWLAGGIGVVTWQKSINSVRASVAEGRALEHFGKGDLESTLLELDKAINLAPGVPSYYNNKAEIFLAYQIRPESFTEPGCEQQTANPYLVCLGLQSLNSNLEAVKQQQFNYRAWLATGNSAFNLGLNQLAIESYSNAVSMVPNVWSMKDDLAESLIDGGFYEEAIAELDRSLGITRESTLTRRALNLKGLALKELGRLDMAVETLKNGVQDQPSLDLIYEINGDRGVRFNVEYFDQIINQNPQDMVAIYSRGLANLGVGNYEKAVLDIDSSIKLGLLTFGTFANQSYARLKAGVPSNDLLELVKLVGENPRYALLHAYIGEYQFTLGNYPQALNYLDNANILDADLGLAYLIRGKLYMSLGIETSAKEVIYSSAGLDLPTAPDYVDRGELYAFFGDYDLAFSDLNEAIRINPNQAKYYNARAKTYGTMSDFEAALVDFNAAIQIGPPTSEFFINRGVLYDLLGDSDSSLADFETATSLGEVDIPFPDDRKPSYFAAYTDSAIVELDAKLLLKLQFERQAQRDIEYNSRITTDDPLYQTSLQFIGQARLELKMWQAAIGSFSGLIALSPTVAEAYKNRGDAYLALKQYDEALSDYEQAIKYASNSDNFVARGTGYAGIGEYELARADFTEAIRLDPESSDAYANRGYVSVQTGNHSDALPDLDHAIVLAPTNHDAYFKRAEAYFGSDQKLLALSDLGQAINYGPTTSDYVYTRAILYLAMSESDLALKDFNSAIVLNNSNNILIPMYGGPYVDRGREYLRRGNVDGALDDAAKAIALLIETQVDSQWRNHLPDIDRLLTDAYELLGDAYTQSGRHSAAQAAYQKASELR